MVAKRGRGAVAHKTVGLGKDCDYRAQVRVRARRLAKGGGKLWIVAKWQGNERIRPRRSRTVKVHYGPHGAHTASRR